MTFMTRSAASRRGALRRTLTGVAGTALLTAGAALTGAHAQNAAGERAAATGQTQELTGVAAALERLLESDIRVRGEELHEDPLAAFYADRGYRPMWTGDFGPTRAAERLLTALQNAAREGLDPSDYFLRDLKRLAGGTDAEDRARFELLMSEALSEYGTDLEEGRVRARIDYPRGFHLVERIDRLDVLRDAGNARDLSSFLDDLHEDNFIYERLRRALADYRDEVKRRASMPDVPGGENLMMGDRSPRVVALRERLAMDDAVTGSTGGSAYGEWGNKERPSDLYDENVVAAVKEFQQANDLMVDGIVGPNTRSALNADPEDRLDQILINMERARWLPDDLGEKFALVDVAGFNLHLRENGRQYTRMPVVVGKDYHQTPMFADEIEHMIVNPYWNVPNSIATEEIAPKMQRDPNYIAEKDMEVFSSWQPDARKLNPREVDWVAVENGEESVFIRQRPGPSNSLGQIKFMFPNDYAIYLHDTPANYLFDRESRAFSHGCIRVERPLDVARFLLDEKENWTVSRVRSIMEGGPGGLGNGMPGGTSFGGTGSIEVGEKTQINLDRHVPVYITYFTAFVDDDGALSFRPDVYERDRKLLEVLKPNQMASVN